MAEKKEFNLDVFDTGGDKMNIETSESEVQVTFSDFNDSQVTLSFNHRHIRDFEEVMKLLISLCPHDRIKDFSFGTVCLDCGKELSKPEPPMLLLDKLPGKGSEGK